MPIVLQDPGIGGGIAQALTGLSGGIAAGLQQRSQSRLQQQQRGALESALSDQSVDLTTPQGQMDFSQKFIQAGGDPTVLSSVLKPYQGILNQRAKSQGAQDYINSIFQKSDQLGQNLEETAPNLQAVQPVIEQPISPGMDRNSVVEDNVKIIDTLELPDGRVISDEQISQLIASPYEEARRLGEDYRKTLTTKQEREYKESSDIRKEHRSEIRDIVEPYSDFTSLKDKVSRMDQVVDLIEKEGTNFDDNAWKNVAVALVEDQHGALLADTLKTEEQQKLFSLLRPLFNTKELGGSNPSTREMMATLATLPGYTKTKEANRFIGKLLQNNAKEILETAKAMRSLRDENLTVAQFQQRVEDKIEPIRRENQKDLEVLNQMSFQAKKLEGAKPEKGQVYMFYPQNGKVYSIADAEVEEALREGGIRFNAK